MTNNSNSTNGTLPVEGWYPVARQTQRWWNGERWSDDVTHHGRKTTVSALRRSATYMMWIWVSLGIVAWLAYIVLSVINGSSTAFALASLPLFGTVVIIVSTIYVTKLKAVLPPA